MQANRIKRSIARVLDAVGICWLGLWLQRAIYGPHIRAVNYHGIEASDVESFERQLAFYSRHFANVSRNGLAEFLSGGTMAERRPGLILSFDDGHRSHFEIAVPVLEKYGFTGWFFVPSRESELSHGLLLELASHHVVGSHTHTHCRMTTDVSAEVMNAEIVGSRSELERMLGREVDSFAWVGGEEESYSRAAADLIRNTYKLGFMTNSSVITSRIDPHQLQRTNIEADQPLWLVRFQLSGLMDIYYYFKRRRVNRLTAQAS